MTASRYRAIVDHVEDRQPSCCGNCGWVGVAADTAEIDECSLTPGDPSPVGRCPECDSIAYVKMEPSPVFDDVAHVLREGLRLMPLGSKARAAWLSRASSVLEAFEQGGLKS
ncbi:hypothetical protein M3795_25425 [Ralstonia pickettii]|uniref:hypothetical protein n=1 Tax=Ralstonia pickettii TaxID=329 RepID=UPI0020419612|nr:hypothetical protein [Ralstonia pickettii]MCM3583816.1 hypothetical protein [Ralstonia pickettii]